MGNLIASPESLGSISCYESILRGSISHGRDSRDKKVQRKRLRIRGGLVENQGPYKLCSVFVGV